MCSAPLASPLLRDGRARLGLTMVWTVTGLLPACRGAEGPAEAGLQYPSRAAADRLPRARQVLVQQPALAYWANVASRKSLLHAAAGALAPAAAALLPRPRLPCRAPCSRCAGAGSEHGTATLHPEPTALS